MQNELIVFGHSHVWALRSAMMRGIVNLGAGDPEVVIALCGSQEFPAELVYSDSENRISINAALLSGLYRVGGKPAEDILLSCVQGNQYNAIGLLTDGVPFDFHLPGWRNPPMDGVELIPYRAVRAALEEQWDEFRQLIPRLKTLKYRGLFHMCPPPPIPDAAYIAAAIPPPPNGNKLEVMAAETRLKLWILQREITRDIVEKAGAVYLDSPQSTMDSDGYLAKPFWKDAVHGNYGYGKLAMEDALAAVARLTQAGGGL